MRTARWFLFLLLFLAVFFFKPAKSLAFSLQDVGPNLSASTNENIYRLRSLGKNWQLSALTVQQVSAQPVVFGHQLFLAAKTDSQWQVYRSTNGLNYFPLTGLSGETVRLIERDQQLFVITLNSSTVKAYAINQNFDVIELVGFPGANLDDTDRLLVLHDQIFYGQQQDSLLRLHAWQPSGWQAAVEFGCSGASLILKPLVGFACQDGQLFYPAAVDHWQSLFPASIQNLAFSSRLIVANDQSNNLYLWQTDLLTTYALSLSGRTILATKALDDRVFLNLSDGSWWEFDPTSQLLVPTPGDLSAVFAADQPRLFVKIGSSYWLSDQIGNWQTVAVDGDFTAVKKVTGGWLAWQSGGSLTQFAADDTLTFGQVPTSWAASSQIQSVYADGPTGFVLLLNASGNPNLYQTTGYGSWSRITLPSSPTFSLPINQLRSLPANSLVEVTGVTSVARGVVSAETSYLQDQTGGIQLFLDNSKGQLPSSVGQLAVATGQISSSQTKRVLLSASDDLVLGGDQGLAFRELAVDELAAQLGEAVKTSALIEEAEKDFYLLKTATGTIKFHFPVERLAFAQGSTVRLPLVVDYNASSGQVETWYLGQGAELLSAPTPPTSSPTVTPASTKAPTTAPTKTAAAVKTSQVSARPNPTGSLSTSAVASGKESTKVAAAKNKPNETDSVITTVMIIGGFLAGALAMRGGRVQELFRA